VGTRAQAQSSTAATKAAWRGPVWRSSASWWHSPRSRRVRGGRGDGRGREQGRATHQVSDHSQRPEQQLGREAAEGEVLRRGEQVAGRVGGVRGTAGRVRQPRRTLKKRPKPVFPGSVLASGEKKCHPMVWAYTPQHCGGQKKKDAASGTASAHRAGAVSQCLSRCRGRGGCREQQALPPRRHARTSRWSAKQATVRAVEAAVEGSTRDEGALLLPCPPGAGPRRATAMAAGVPPRWAASAGRADAPRQTHTRFGGGRQTSDLIIYRLWGLCLQCERQSVRPGR
jgi:hypothetical protein